MQLNKTNDIINNPNNHHNTKDTGDLLTDTNVNEKCQVKV